MNRDSFTDIKLIGLDVDATQSSEAAAGLRHMYLRLSAQPSSEWQELFDQERQFPRHSMWRADWIEGNFIVVDCVPEEINSIIYETLKRTSRKRITTIVTIWRESRAHKNSKRKRSRRKSLGSKT